MASQSPPVAAKKDKSAFSLSSLSSSSVVDVSSLGPRRRRNFLMAQGVLRFSAIVFTLVAITVTVTTSQTVVIFGLKFTARYNYSSSIKFLVAADAVMCSFSAVSLILVYLLSHSGSPLKNYFFLFLFDTVMMVLSIAGCAAATATGYIAKYGEEHMTWQRTCGYVPDFCNKLSISLAFSYLAFFAYLLLILISTHTLIIYRPVS